MIKTCFIAICLVFTEIMVFGQDTVPVGKWIVQKTGKPTIKPSGIFYFFRKYDMEQGLENPCILRIRQNNDDEILFGTENGAGIFDGENFTIFNVTICSSSLQNWQGNIEQVDDITILGFTV